jgi:hypothetical protein
MASGSNCSPASVRLTLRVSTFGKSAERARELRRGALVTVRGRLDPYQARDGNLRVALVADELEWAGR